MGRCRKGRPNQALALHWSWSQPAADQHLTAAVVRASGPPRHPQAPAASPWHPPLAPRARARARTRRARLLGLPAELVQAARHDWVEVSEHDNRGFDGRARLAHHGQHLGVGQGQGRGRVGRAGMGQAQLGAGAVPLASRSCCGSVSAMARRHCQHMRRLCSTQPSSTQTSMHPLPCSSDPPCPEWSLSAARGWRPPGWWGRLPAGRSRARPAR